MEYMKKRLIFMHETPKRQYHYDPPKCGVWEKVYPHYSDERIVKFIIFWHPVAFFSKTMHYAGHRIELRSS